MNPNEKTFRYTDALGHHYDVPDHLLPEFERRRGILLRIAIVGQSIMLAAILAFAWYVAPVWLHGEDPYRAAVNAAWATVICVVVGSLYAFRQRPRVVVAICLLVMVVNLGWFLVHR